jgi:hypothetical protein
MIEQADRQMHDQPDHARCHRAWAPTALLGAEVGPGYQLVERRGVEAQSRGTADGPAACPVCAQAPRSELVSLADMATELARQLRHLVAALDADCRGALPRAGPGLASSNRWPGLTRRDTQVVQTDDGGGVAVSTPRNNHGDATTVEWQVLSPRLREVARLLAEGLSDREISVRLRVTVKTARHYSCDVLSRLELHCRCELRPFRDRAHVR